MGKNEYVSFDKETSYECIGCYSINDKAIAGTGFVESTCICQAFFSDTSNPFIPLTEDEIYNQLKKARDHAASGKMKDARQVSANVREKYGL